MKILILISLLAFAGCSTNVDYVKLSNERACGQDDCGKEPE